MIKGKINFIVTCGVILIWLLIGAGSGWWMWVKYRAAIQAEETQLSTSTVELDVITIDKAAEVVK